MPKVMKLRDSKDNQVVHIVGPTQLGRSEDLHWKVPERNIPEEFHKLDLILQINGSNRVSRNHAGILKDIEGNFNIIDLNSQNGTSINGQNILPSVQTPLNDNDEISLADRIQFTVDEITEIKSPYNALLIGNPGWNLRGVREDIDRLGEQLEKRGFKDNIRILYKSEATVTNVLDQLEQLKYVTDKDSRTIVYYSGHGSNNGLDLFDKKLKPKELYQALKFRGKKAVILDSCHAGTFIRGQTLPTDTLVIAASSKDGKAYEGNNHPIANGKRMGIFTSALVKYFSTEKERFNLREIERYLRDELKEYKIRVGQQDPNIQGIEEMTIATYNTCRQ